MSAAPVYEGVNRCTAFHCDIDEDGLKQSNAAISSMEAEVFTSSMSGKRLKRTVLAFTPNSASEQANAGASIVLKPGKRFQKIEGFGGALTDAAAENLALMDEDVRTAILQQYFGDAGARYTLARVPIGGSDFSSSAYTYDDLDANEQDFDLKSFSIEMDLDKKLPLIKDAMKLGQEVKILASIWSPPAWMKDGNGGLVGGSLKNDKHTRKSYAEYHSKFISEYEKRGVKIWAMTLQNEPVKLWYIPRYWNSMDVEPADARAFIAQFGPILREKHPDVKLLIHDDDRTLLSERVNAMMKKGTGPDISPYVDGFGFHWYWALNDNLDHFDHVAKAAKEYPNMLLLSTEACEGYLPWSQGPSMGSWEYSEAYAYDIIGDLNAGAHGWIDWNIVLNTEGGPNWAKNFVDAPIIVDPAHPGVYYKQPMWYSMVHLSRFIPPGSYRIDCHTSFKWFSSLSITCFQLPDNANNIVIVLQNCHNFDVSYTIEVPNKGMLNSSIEKRSLQTLVFSDAIPK